MLPNLSNLSLLNGVSVEAKRKREEDEFLDAPEEDEEETPPGPFDGLSPELILLILDKIKDDKDVIVCETVKSWCATKKSHQSACDGKEPGDKKLWKTLAKRVFEKSPIFKKFKDNPSPKEAFFDMCNATELANAVAKRFIFKATRDLGRRLISNRQLKYHPLYEVIDGWIETADDERHTAAGKGAFDDLYKGKEVVDPNYNYMDPDAFDGSYIEKDYDFRRLVKAFTKDTIALLVWDNLLFWDKDSIDGYTPDTDDLLTLVHERLHVAGRELGVQVVCLLQDKYDLNKANDNAYVDGRLDVMNESRLRAISKFKDAVKNAGISIVKTAFHPEPQHQHGKPHDDYLRYLRNLVDDVMGGRV